MIYFVSLFSIAAVYILAKYFAKVNLNIERLSLLNIVFYRDYIIFTCFAIIYWTFNENYKNHYILNVVQPDDMLTAQVASGIFMSIFYVCTRLWNSVLFRVVKTMPRCNGAVFVLLLKIWTLSLGAILLYFYISEPPPISKIFSGLTVMEFSELRHEASAPGLLGIVRMSWIPLTCYTWIYLYHRKISSNPEIKIGFKSFLVLSFVMAILSSLWSVEKSLFSAFLIGVLGVYLLASDRSISLRRLLLVVGLSLIFIVIFYIVLNMTSGTDFEQLLSIIYNRFFAQAAGVVYSFYYFPDIADYKTLSGISNFLANVQGEKFSSVYADLIDHAAPEFADISGAMSSFAAGDAYGLFGWVGVFFGPIFASFWYTLFYVFSKNESAAPVFVGIYGVYFGNAYLASSFYSFVWPVGILTALFPILTFYLLSVRLR